MRTVITIKKIDSIHIVISEQDDKIPHQNHQCI
jgi:hypothetical protein